MKKVILFLSLLFVYQELKAQKILFQQNFDGYPGYSITGWTHRITGPVPWQAGEPYLVGECIGPLMDPTGIVTTNKVAAIVDCSALTDYNNSNDLMFTKPISLASDTGAWLKYDSYFGKYVSGTHTEVATVEISTDTGKTWTVLQDVPANMSMTAYATYYISLSAYNHAPAIWIGFRYNDGGGHMHGWAIDNMQVFVPAQKDIALTSVTPYDPLQGYVQINTGYTHSATVYNAGNDTITSFLLNYRQDAAGPIYSQLVSGISIPRFGTYSFIHHIPDTVHSAAAHNIAVWATLLGDSIHYNDSANVVLHGAYFLPAKRSLIEDGTSIQNGYCPKNWVLMNNTPVDVDVCKVSVHFGDSDAMELKYYDDYLYLLHWPNNAYIYVDRHRILPDLLNDVINKQKDYFGFADLTLNPQISGDSLVMNVALKPAIDLGGHFSLALAITEDHVTGSDSQYAQRNFYAGGGMGPMGGFESKPNPVPASQMVYNFVARTIRPDPGGDTAIVPHSLTHNVVYNYSLGAKISSAWQQNKLRAVVMLIRNDDTTVLNSNQTQWYLGVEQWQKTNFAANLYPNPATDNTTLYFDLDRAHKLQILVTDIMGRAIFVTEGNYLQGENKLVLPVNNVSSGIYFVTIQGEEIKYSLKLEVVK